VNFNSLEFFLEGENGESITLFKLEGYDKVTSSTIRYSEDTHTTQVEIQLSKGV
jgi:hypothetical protein